MVRRMPLELEIILRVLLATLLGGAVGFDRQRSNKPAGLRTHMLVAMGAALFAGAGVITLSEFAGGPDELRHDILRVVAAIATGIGFLGAGVIFQSAGTVRGLTTAAGIWVTAGIGLAAGLGMIGLSIGTAVLAVIVIAVVKAEMVGEVDVGEDV